MRRSVLRSAAALAAALCACLAPAPVPAEPVAWQPAAGPGYAGPYAASTRPAGLQRPSCKARRPDTSRSDRKAGCTPPTALLETADRRYIRSVQAPAPGGLPKARARL